MGTEFEIILRGQRVGVAEHYIGKNQIFRAVFADGKQPLVLTKTKSYEPGKFWTSIPEGRQKEAEEIGNLITEHFNKK